MAYKIVFSDIDGTLLGPDHKIPGGVREQVRALEERGIPFVLVSSRSPEGMRYLRAELGSASPMASYGGALVLDGADRVLHSRGFSREKAAALKAFLASAVPGLCVSAFSGETWVVDDAGDPWVRQEIDITGARCRTGTLEEVLAPDDTVHKLLCMGEPEGIRAAQAALNRDFPALTAASSKDTYLEVMERGVCKSAAMAVLCGHYGCTVAEAVALGDNFNDLDMLEAAGCGVAMGNAPDAVKERADLVTLPSGAGGMVAALTRLFG